MNIATLPGVSSPPAFTPTGRMLPTVLERESSDTGSAVNHTASTPAAMSFAAGPAAGVLHPFAERHAVAATPAQRPTDTVTLTTAGAPSNVSSRAALSPVTDAAKVPSQPITTKVPAAASTDNSLISNLERYTAAADRGESQAYQEYAKAWGGRVVHGEVELPPLSIYAE